MVNLDKRVLEALKESKRLTGADLEKALNLCSKEENAKLAEVLVRLGLVSEKEILPLVSHEVKIPFLNLAKYKVNRDLVKFVPEKIARKHRVVPISKIGNVLTLAVEDPFNVLAIDDVTISARCKVERVLSSPKDIEDALNRLYSAETQNITEIADAASSSNETVEFMKNEDDLSFAHTNLETSEAPIVRMVDLLIREALKKRASDIHVEPFEKNVKVRFRVDGNLEEVLTIPKKNQNGVLTRIKIMSRLDITESRVPQDGRFKIRFHDKEVDFRVSVLPVHFGSKVVMRILDKSALSFGLDHLGFFPETLSNFKNAVKKPFGMILITGPTGSGKSTTLYSILSQLNTPEKNIITIEDPIEYQLKGITQIQVKPEIGLDFASGLRAILRQSPDIVMVGEIRDFETVDIAIKASLTGQLVFSTLHTNDSAGAITRLMDMGVEPFLIASSMILVAAQRLCRRTCPFCKEKVDIPKEVFDRLNISYEKLMAEVQKQKGAFFQGKGCAKCNHTGFLGRMGVLETFVMDDDIRNLVIRRASAFEIKDLALKKGMLTLREDALKKFAAGFTTLDEVINVTSGDQ